MNKKKFAIILTTLFFLLSIPVLTSARAGGGGSGSSSGGSSSSSSSSSGTYNNYYDDYGNSSYRGAPLGGLATFAIIICIGFKDKIILACKLKAKSMLAKKIINMAANNDARWDYKEIKARVKDTFYIVQKSWTLRDADYAKDYTSKELMEKHNAKLQWMLYKHELNVLKNIKLIQAKPIAAVYSIDRQHDFIWFYVKGAMTDYIINDTTSEIIDGNTRPGIFSEYWKFIKVNDVWVLDQISQIDEIDVDELYSQYENI